MSDYTCRRDGDEWTLAWDAHSVGVGIQRVREERDGLACEVVVESMVPGAQGRLIGPVRLNLLSSESQTRFANVLLKRAPVVPWGVIVSQACALVAKQYRAPSPTLRVADIADEGPVEYLIPGLVPACETTVLFADGESGKSMLAMRIALSVASGEPLPWGAEPTAVVPVLYLDWETNARTIKIRMRRLAEGMGIPIPSTIHYRGASRTGSVLRSLDEELPNLRAEVSRLGIGLVVVDSIGYAASGALVEDQTARAAMTALRQLDPATRLVVAHVSNATAQQTQGSGRPFGSAFFWNGMRSGIEIRKSESSSDGVLELGMFHRKSNDGAHHRPVGLRALFDGEEGPVRYERTDIAEIPDMTDRLPISQRIRALLKAGQRDTKAIAESLDIKPDTVIKTLKRMEDVVRLDIAAGGRGNTSMWGLSG